MRTRSSTAKPAQALQSRTNAEQSRAEADANSVGHASALHHSEAHCAAILRRLWHAAKTAADRPTLQFCQAGVIIFAVPAPDLTEYDVPVSTIRYGEMPTELNEAARRAWAQRQQPSDRQPFTTRAAAKNTKPVSLKHWQSPPDIAAAAVFLSSLLHSNITGQTSNGDGVFVMHA
ncbi:hypothetical protein EMGBD1_04130 [Anaerolineaceae bacterium]|nr:hypothetical protein EMGBD1_04130 [Anaerolineaceae bacterium]